MTQDRLSTAEFASEDKRLLDDAVPQPGSPVLSGVPEAVAGVTDLVERAAKLLEPCPEREPGERRRHKWMLRSARVLVELGCSDQEVEEIIEDRLTREPDSPNEIRDILRHVRGGGPKSSTPRWPLMNPAAIAQAVKDGPTLRELIERSPEPIRFDLVPKTEFYIDALFPGNPLLCAGVTNSNFATVPRETFRGALHLYPLIVPSPMSSKTGLTKDGRPSEHCEANTGPRKHLVVEFDNGSLNRQAALLWHLQKIWPLAMVVFSGSKSLHGWFRCLEESEEKVEKFFRYAVSLGADTATWKRFQFVRMPDGKREWARECEGCQALKGAGIDGTVPRRQSVFYFNSGVIT
jgi:hypothetical protein